MDSKDIYKAPKYYGQGKGILKDNVLFKYPKTKVILAYLFQGGAIGGLFVCFYSTFVAKSVDFDLYVISVFMLGGAIYGAIPALITGLIIAFREMMIKNIFSYVLIGTIGFSVSFLCIIVVLQTIDGYSLLMGFPGALSAIILAEFFVPKD